MEQWATNIFLAETTCDAQSPPFATRGRSTLRLYMRCTIPASNLDNLVNLYRIMIQPPPPFPQKSLKPLLPLPSKHTNFVEIFQILTLI